MKMSYHRAWQLVEDLNRNFGSPVVETAAGWVTGGGARLTNTGATRVQDYHALEQATAVVAQPHL